MTTIHAMVGIPGCGKSTFASRLVNALGPGQTEYVNPDSIRRRLILRDGLTPTSPGYHPDVEPETWAEAHATLSAAVGREVPYAVFDATNLTIRARQAVIDSAYEGNGGSQYGLTFVAWLFQTPWEQCVEQNRIRARVVPDEVMERMREQASLVSALRLRQEGWNVVPI